MISALLTGRQKFVVWGAIVAVAFILLSIPVIGNAFFAMLLLGVIPFIGVQLPPWVMLLVYIGFATLLLVWLSGSQLPSMSTIALKARPGPKKRHSVQRRSSRTTNTPQRTRKRTTTKR